MVAAAMQLQRHGCGSHAVVLSYALAMPTIWRKVSGLSSREDSQFHRMLPLSRVLSSEGAVTTMTSATAHNVTR
jgi:hypothetical protein